ncbi:MAG: amidohydrolase [Phycisphaerales bacterium]
MVLQALLLMLVAGVYSGAGDHAAFAQPADLVIHNAHIWTADPEQPQASAVVVRDGRIVAVLQDGGDMQKWVGPDTQMIDAEGAFVMPGLIDTHVHLEGAASDMRHLDLRPARSRAELLEMVHRYAAGFDEDAWVVGTRWSAESWPDQQPPSADEIDVATGGRKAILIRMDGHSLLASRSALEYSQIDAAGPPDPAGGTIGRDATGTPTGQVYEQAMALLWKHAELPEVDTRDLLKRAIAHANANGITQVGAIESSATLRELAALDEAGELTLRIDATVRYGVDTVASWMSELEWAAANRMLSPGVRVLGFKGFMDGTLGSRTAWQMQPYDDNHMAEDKADDNAGFPLAMAGTGALADLIATGSAMDLQPAVHAIGDRSNHELLNWYESLPAEQRRALRPRIEHAQHLLPDDVARFAQLGVIPSMQPYHKADDGRYAEQRLGPIRIQTSYAFRGLLDSGACLAFGSDWPVVSVNPFLGIAAAVTAETLDGKVFIPEQSLTCEEALICYTRNAAFCLHSEDETGMIKPGYQANMVVLNHDIRSAKSQNLARTHVRFTFVNGEMVFERRE